MFRVSNTLGWCFVKYCEGYWQTWSEFFLFGTQISTQTICPGIKRIGYQALWFMSVTPAILEVVIGLQLEASLGKKLASKTQCQKQTVYGDAC
jgi:hypothetical protein